MRLIDTHTGHFREFSEPDRPQYAILSHTWGRQETSYFDYLVLTSDVPATARGLVQSLFRSPSKESEGYQKIEACCRLARERHFRWVWIDSCCIDKSSSAELSEAINSMWGWYCDATECFVYLGDVSAAAHQLKTDGQILEALRRARWFTRGWTLQELLATRQVTFCNRRWETFAQKAGICGVLSTITRIPEVFLNGTYSPADRSVCSVAMKMSWLARRETTRAEDMAYCMLGLFDVQMPLLYGEGRKAFMRLQLEIVKKVDDDSIFAWTSHADRYGLLANWPNAFANSGNIVQINFPEDPTPWLPATMTSLGLEMKGRYQRRDKHQLDIDANHGVQTISTALPACNETSMVMHCGPCGPGDAPITQQWSQQDRGRALVIQMRRFGATWQRVNCTRLELTEYSMYIPSQSDAYTIYYFPQEGV